jgi:deoxyribodipyrimidine photo-lyase
MQSGVTGINTVRIYSPEKQVLDQDPKGVFIRRWVPELQNIPDEYLAQPYTPAADDARDARSRDW